MQTVSEQDRARRDHLLTDEFSFSFVFSSATGLASGVPQDFVSKFSGGGLPVVPTPYVNSAWKRLFDVTASCLLILIMSPALLIVAVGIKIGSPGPVFFRQEREGRYGSTFNILKFRTMYADAADRTASKARPPGSSPVPRWPC